VTAAEEAALQLSREERLHLIEKLWESLVDEESRLEVPDDVRAELDRRLAAHRENPDEALSWAEVKRRVRGGE
jgi:putative addiction module component (TIGR02574 family)